MNMFKSKLENVLKGLAQDLAEERLANNRLMAVCGMNVEEITDAFINGYRLMSPEAAKDDIPDDLRIVPKNTTNWIPVSKRLPNNDEYIKNNGLFNVSDGNRSYSEWFDIYDKQRFGEPTISGFRVDHAVTAWMPLPEPYKAESEES